MSPNILGAGEGVLACLCSGTQEREKWVSSPLFACAFSSSTCHTGSEGLSKTSEFYL